MDAWIKEDEMTGGWDEQWVQDRAYAIWERAGHPEGKALGHWLQAEAEIAAERQGPKRSASPTRRASPKPKPKASLDRGQSRGTGDARAIG